MSIKNATTDESNVYSFFGVVNTHSTYTNMSLSDIYYRNG